MTQPDAEALAACQAAAAGVRGLSGERKQTEMLKIMALPDALAAAEAMQKADLLRPILGIEPVDFDMLTAIMPLSDDPLLAFDDADAQHRCRPCAGDNLRLSKKQTMRVMTALERPLDVEQIASALYFDGAEAVADRARLALAAGQGDAAVLEEALLAAAQFTRPKFPLTGAMMQAAGLASGPDMGVMSKALEDWWVEQGFPDAAAVEAELKRRV